MRREKDRARRSKGKKRSPDTDDYEKERLATLKRLKQGDENELERKLRLAKMVATKQLRLAKETDEERRGRLATKRVRLAMETDEETQARLEKMVATKQLRLAKETDEERRGRLAAKRLRLAMETDEETQARL